jgi:hypothetical protein
MLITGSAARLRPCRTPPPPWPGAPQPREPAPRSRRRGRARPQGAQDPKRSSRRSRFRHSTPSCFPTQEPNGWHPPMGLPSRARFGGIPTWQFCYVARGGAWLSAVALLGWTKTGSPLHYEQRFAIPTGAALSCPPRRRHLRVSLPCKSTPLRPARGWPTKHTFVPRAQRGCAKGNLSDRTRALGAGPSAAQPVRPEGRPPPYSHSIVPGGFEVMSSVTRFTCAISLIMREATFSSRS